MKNEKKKKSKDVRNDIFCNLYGKFAYTSPAVFLD
jgi:hypothetical protein